MSVVITLLNTFSEKNKHFSFANDDNKTMGSETFTGLVMFTVHVVISAEGGCMDNNGLG